MSFLGSNNNSSSNPNASGGAPLFGSFGGQANSTPTPATTGFGSFGTTASSKPTFSFNSTASKPQASGGLFGATSGGSFGSTDAKAPANSFSSGGFKFGASAAPTSAAEAKTSSGFGGFGMTPTAAEAKPAETKPNPITGTGVSGFKVSSAPSEAPESTKQAAAAAKGVNSTSLANTALRGKTLDEIIQTWTNELAAQTRAFHTQANTVGYWDRALVQQGKRITELYDATMRVESEQAALDQSLEHMEGQQKALEALLDTYEGRVQNIVKKTTKPPSKAGRATMGADEERAQVYASAERLNTQLDELARRLAVLVDDVNGVASTDAAPAKNDAFAQIVQILNAHLTSLEWIDSQSEALRARVKEAQRVHQQVVAANESVAGAEIRGKGASSPVLTIPGALNAEPAPPLVSTFGTPAGGRSSAGAALGSSSVASPFRYGR